MPGWLQTDGTFSVEKHQKLFSKLQDLEEYFKCHPNTKYDKNICKIDIVDEQEQSINLEEYICLNNENPPRVKIYIKSKGVLGDVESEDEEDNLVSEEPVVLDPEEDKLDDEENTEALKYKYMPVWLSSNAITLSGGIQLVIRFYGEVDEIHQNYDFTHAKNIWESSTQKLTLNPEAFECLLANELRYSINAGQILKIILDIHKLDLTNISVLRDQLIGVDSAFFGKIIAELQKDAENKSDYQVDTGYLVELIDRTF